MRVCTQTRLYAYVRAWGWCCQCVGVPVTRCWGCARGASRRVGGGTGALVLEPIVVPIIHTLCTGMDAHARDRRRAMVAG